MLISFILLFDASASKANFNSFELPVKRFLDFIESATVSAAKEIIESMEIKFSERKFALRASQFLKNEKLAFREVGTVQMRQVLRASLAVCTYSLRDCRLRELFIHHFCEWKFPVTLLNDVRFLQLVPINRQAKTHISYEMSVSKSFSTTFYFHAVVFMSRSVERKKLNLVGSVVNSTMASMVV